MAYNGRGKGDGMAVRGAHRAHEGDGRFSGTQALDMGWGFSVAWGLSIVFTGTFAQGDTSNLGTFWLASMIGAPAGLLGFFFVRKRLDRERADLLQLLALAGMVVGTAVLALSMGTDPVLAGGMQLAAGLVSSLGTAVFTVQWGSHYATLDMQRIERSAVFSLIVAFLCYACALVAPRPVSMVIVVCLPFLSAVSLKGAQRRAPGEPASRAASDPPKLDVREFTRIGLGVVGSTTTISLFWSMANSGVIPLERGLFEASVLSGTVVAALLMVYMTRFSRSLNLGTLYRWVLPIIALACALLSVPSAACALVACLLVFACSSLLNLLTFVYFAELSSRTGAVAHRVFGLGRFFLELGFLIGILLAPLVAEAAAQTGPCPAFAFVLAVLVVLTMVSIGVQDRLAFTLEESSEAGRPSLSDVLGKACRKAAHRYGLTKREAEILPFLAQGYSLPYIRNELYIAQSTIDTHVRHIYKKMDVHSREELISKVTNGE